MKTIGNAAGFWGDNLDAPRLLAESSWLDYLTLEYLAELTMSILAHQNRFSSTTILDQVFEGSVPASRNHLHRFGLHTQRPR